jgi:hypothetical protein
MVNNASRFPAGGFWGLQEAEYQALRSLAVFGLGAVGSPADPFLGSHGRPQATGCPDVDRPKASARPSAAASPSWNGAFAGTLCGVVPWMGAIHDKMVVLENHPKDADAQAAVLAEAENVGRYFEAIDLVGVLGNVGPGTCAAPRAASPGGSLSSLTRFNTIVLTISLALVGSIAAFLLCA